jgi:DNA-3-methyladenine glycosylase II
VQAADAHLARDPVMAGLISDFGGPLAEDTAPRRPPDLYGALLRSITGQQLSIKAAQAIYGRLTARFGGRP